MNSTSRTVRLAIAVYRGALHALPREFRDRYGPELVECFGELAVTARLRGSFAVAVVLLHSILDTCFQAVLLRTRRRAPSPAHGGDHMWQDLRYAARRLMRRPSFTFVTVLTLALGVAAATSVFTLVNGVVLSPLPYPQSNRIVQVDHGGHGIGIDKGLGVTVGFFRFYRENLRSVESMGLYFYGNATFTGSGEPVQAEQHAFEQRRFHGHGRPKVRMLIGSQMRIILN